MFRLKPMEQESVNSKALLTPHRAKAAALCKSRRRKMRSGMQFAKRFANENHKA